MNAIMDLTARATSFITAIQTTLLRGSIALAEEDKKSSILTLQVVDFKGTLERYGAAEQNKSSAGFKKSEEDSFQVKATELVWISRREIEVTEMEKISLDYTVVLSVNLFNWIDANRTKGFDALLNAGGDYPTPFEWRHAISKILYTYPEQRLALAVALQYLPIQIVLALGAGHFSAPHQRVLQTWKSTEGQKEALLSKDEKQWLEQFNDSLNVKQLPEALLADDAQLVVAMEKASAPLSFEQVFTAELGEILKNRDRREREQCVARAGKPASALPAFTAAANDPFEKAKQMDGLTALAFSGGGIRSATFNLGILQGLAQKNLIKKFDYLSTVSGGGYIGSWLAAWIKRDGSVVKVTNRLCPDLSPDPSGEELRPIKWLRMFSNYFAPTASIMSADAWTVGITWLRNTLLNQVIIFLTFLSVLFLGNLLFIFWCYMASQQIHYTPGEVILYSIIALIPVSLLAGFGMHAYHSQEIKLLKIKKADTTTISQLILTLGFAGAYIISALFCAKWFHLGMQCESFASKVSALLPAAVINFVALMIVALLGKYSVDIREMLNPCKMPEKNTSTEILTWLLLTGTGAATAAVSLLSMAGVWALLQRIHFKSAPLYGFDSQVKFILGFPLVLEVFSLTLVARMAFLGRYFPDERREWWGRMGAYIHRTSFLWILLSASALLGQHFIFWVFTYSPAAGLVATGSWSALVLSTVKAAFSNKTAANNASSKSFSVFANALALVGPYLFALGLLIFLPGLIKPVYQIVQQKVFQDNGPLTYDHALYLVCIILSCFITALLLSKQVGVNEFSMHHFYRNRLVRAYLGATRRYTDRQKTSNPFTGFDMLDDEKLSCMKNEFGYYGPYPILNVALNASEVTDLDRQDRKAESFIFSPFYAGFDFSMLKASADSKTKSYDYAYRPTEKYAFTDKGPTLGTAMAISGAAINPNQGFHSSAATAFLLTVFNVQMGWWIGNPRKSTWQRSEPVFGLGYIFNNLVGKTNTRSDYVALSDGGHFDNMGLYELVRRKCSCIVLCDAEQDDEFTCEGFANAVRRCRIDFGADITIDISKIVNRKDGRFSGAHYAVGDITYPGNYKPGKLLYIKSSIREDDMPVDVYEYAKKNKTFPHQTTADQFFDEEQFESYRKLGLGIAAQAFSDEVLARINLTDIKK
jgi:Patatin-like phospholipase